MVSASPPRLITSMIASSKLSGGQQEIEAGGDAGGGSPSSPACTRVGTMPVGLFDRGRPERGRGEIEE